MCRIVGLYNRNQAFEKEMLYKMRDTMSYGGPDASHSYIAPSGKLGLGHRRLSILDLSEHGTQPFVWNNLAICYNGEVYNFEEVKSKMPEYEFTTGTDTEVILKAYHKWGKDCVTQFRGMFAFAIWEEKTQRLLLCRDRVGVKPLYWYLKDDLFMFSSELKAFHQNPKFNKTINQQAVSLFLQQGYIHAPHCIFENAHKLEPGHWLEIDSQFQIKKTKYWSIKTAYTNTKADTRNEAEILEELEDKLLDSFKLRMVADVPVGMFLSGGIDSSLVTALLQKEYTQPLKTFTIGFDHPERDEAPYAKKVAEHIGTDHTEMYCTEEEAIGIIPEFFNIYDEPFGDSSGIPTYLLSKLTSAHVKVSLSADGADELFGGYAKYEVAKNFYKKIEKIPSGIRSGLGSVLNQIDPNWLERNRQYFPIISRYNDLNNKFSKLQNSFSAADLHSFFNVASSYLTASQVETFLPKHFPRYSKNGIVLEDDRWISYMGMIDIQTYLEGDIMCKVDRATMQHGLEGREPFLDHELIEFAMQIPDHLKIKGNTSKYLLRKILYKHVPKALIERPKQGFAAPFKDWMLGLLRDEIESIPNDLVFMECFQLNPDTIKITITDFLEQRRYVNPHLIWFLYALSAWHNKWMK
jgi:asparagine synthase (glutamine-hydrolysing)